MQNVIDLFSRRTQPALQVSVQAKVMPSEQVKTEEVINEESSESSKPLTFAEVAARNAANQERLKKEREQANKAVLKSYRIK